MSVPEGLRGTGKLKVVEDARYLSKYTITITANEKVFLPEYQRSLTDDINRIALAIFVEAFSANNITVKSAAQSVKRKERKTQEWIIWSFMIRYWLKKIGQMRWEENPKNLGV